MRVPHCFLCHKPLYNEEKGKCEGGDVAFADYVDLEELNFEEPPGLELFCDEHFAAAQALSHLTSKEALIQLEQQFGKFEEPEPEPEPEPDPPRTKWQRFCNWFWEHLV
jgi:hypothetical protein